MRVTFNKTVSEMSPAKFEKWFKRLKHFKDLDWKDYYPGELPKSKKKEE